MRGVDIKQMRRRNASETASAYYDEVERSSIWMNTRILAGRCLVKHIADITTDIIEREGG